MDQFFNPPISLTVKQSNSNLDNFIASKENSQLNSIAQKKKDGTDGFFNRRVASSSKCMDKLNVSQNFPEYIKQSELRFLNHEPKKGIFFAYPIKAKNWPHPYGITETIT